MILLVLILIFFQLIQFANPVFSKEVKVRLLTGRASVEISSTDTLCITGDKTGEWIMPGTEYITYFFKPDVSGIKMAISDIDTALSAIYLPYEILIKPQMPESKLLLNKKGYRGNLLIKRINIESLEVINILHIEDYIRGTIKYEISPLWPEEAIKAYIVAARTYALFQKRNNKNKDFVLESSVLSQVYGGCSGEDTFSDTLVWKTEGEYIDYRGNITEGFYHACCGGYTENALNVWGVRSPYLQGRRCPFCRDSPHYYWERKFSLNRIQNALRKNGYSVTNITDIRVTKRSDTGRAIDLEIRHQQEKLNIRGTEFRRIIGYNNLPSTLFTVYRRGKEELIFTGRGWGHGVGMCQWGAKGMALLGYNYHEILKFYYPETEIKKLTDGNN